MATVAITEYYKPLRAIITIRDKTNDPTFLYHNSFDPPEPSSGSPAIYYCDVDLAYGQSGTFTLRINDHEHQLDESKIGLGNKVWIQAGRDEDHLFNLFSGVCRSMKPIRAGYKLLGYEMSGFGTQIIFNERIVNYLRTALRNPTNPNQPFIEDPNMKAYKLFQVLMVNNDVIPLFYPAIKHTLHAGMFDTTSEIDPRVDTFIASLTEPYVEGSQVANNITEMAGGVWGVSPQAPGQPDKVFLRFPSTFHSGTIIKDKPDPLNPDEYINKNVAYLRSSPGFSWTDSMRKEDGFTNRIFSKTGADIATGSTSTNAENFTSMIGLEVAQQITINSTQIRDIAVTCSIAGKGETTPGGNIYNPRAVRFRVVNDDAGRPGSILETSLDFQLPLDTGETRSLFLQLPQAFQPRVLKPGDKAWLIMLQEGIVRWEDGAGPRGDCGTPQTDFCARWHHDGGNTGISAVRTVCDISASARGGAHRTPPADDLTSGWVINNAGPTYSHTFFDQFSHIIEASDQESIDHYGEVDSFIDFSFLTDENAMNQMLSSILQFAAKPRRIYEMSEVYIPFNSLIEPGSLVTIIDPMAGHTEQKQLTAEVQEVRYTFQADASGTNPVGINTCEVRLLGYVDFREQMVLAISEASIQSPITTGGSPPPEPPPPPPDPTLGELDTDGVKIIMPRNMTQGKFHKNMVGLPNLGASNWTSSTYFKHDCGNSNTADKQTSGSLTYWHMPARTGTFASTGETNYTCRPTWLSSNADTPAGVTGAKNRGYLANANDPKNLEITAILRVRNIEDNGEEATFKVRGDDHEDTNEKTLQMGCKFPYGSGDQAELWMFEKTHPSDRRADVTFVAPFNQNNYPKVSNNVWRGIKAIVYNINNNQGVHCEWWIDEDPLEGGGTPTGKFNNNWKKMAIYEEQGKSDTPTWGGPANTLRTD